MDSETGCKGAGLGETALSERLNYLCVCVCVCASVCVCVCICVYVYTDAHACGGQRFPLTSGVLPQVLSTLCFETGSLTYLKPTK